MAKERILVVDDERNIVELIKYNLEKEGYEVICAYDGIEAVNIAKQDRPDLIILDIMLPGQGGLEVTRILRREMRTPIIMATAKARRSIRFSVSNLAQTTTSPSRSLPENWLLG